MRHHGAALRELAGDAEWARAFASDWRRTLPDLDPAEQALLAYVEKLTLAPATVRAEDVDRLRTHDFDDRMIHDAAAVAAYFAFVNRLADGLGVELEREGEGEESR